MPTRWVAHGATVQSTLPVAPSYVTFTEVTPGLTPTTTPVPLTVTTLVLPEDQVTPAASVMSLFDPSGIVAFADIWTEFVRVTAQGSGLRAIADTLEDGVELPHAARIQARPATGTETRADKE